MTSDAEPLSDADRCRICDAVYAHRTWCTLEDIEALEAERDELQRWVADLQSDMYINCVYCGHRYGPNDEVPASMADVLREHIEQCPKHPMSELQRQVEAARTALEQLKQVLADVREIERKAGLVLAQEAVYARTEKTLTPNAPTAILEASKLLVDIEIACMALGLPLKVNLAPQPAPTDGEAVESAP